MHFFFTLLSVILCLLASFPSVLSFLEQILISFSSLRLRICLRSSSFLSALALYRSYASCASISRFFPYSMSRLVTFLPPHSVFFTIRSAFVHQYCNVSSALLFVMHVCLVCANMVNQLQQTYISYDSFSFVGMG